MRILIVWATLCFALLPVVGCKSSSKSKIPSDPAQLQRKVDRMEARNAKLVERHERQIEAFQKRYDTPEKQQAYFDEQLQKQIERREKQREKDAQAKQKQIEKQSPTGQGPSDVPAASDAQADPQKESER
jgi:exonuclease VII large subunit